MPNGVVEALGGMDSGEAAVPVGACVRMFTGRVNERTNQQRLSLASKPHATLFRRNHDHWLGDWSAPYMVPL